MPMPTRGGLATRVPVGLQTQTNRTPSHHQKNRIRQREEPAGRARPERTTDGRRAATPAAGANAYMMTDGGEEGKRTPTAKRRTRRTREEGVWSWGTTRGEVATASGGDTAKRDDAGGSVVGHGRLLKCVRQRARIDGPSCSAVVVQSETLMRGVAGFPTSRDLAQIAALPASLTRDRGKINWHGTVTTL